jgi:hypothetical protein
VIAADDSTRFASFTCARSASGSDSSRTLFTNDLQLTESAGKFGYVDVFFAATDAVVPADLWLSGSLTTSTEHGACNETA